MLFQDHSVTLKLNPRAIEFPSQGSNRLLSDWMDFAQAEVEYRDAKNEIRTDPNYLAKAKGFKLGAAVR